jgi:hypothetical protein
MKPQQPRKRRLSVTTEQVEKLVGRGRRGIGPSALDTLAEELVVLAHYCETVVNSDEVEFMTALLGLGETLFRMSERVSTAADLAAAEHAELEAPEAQSGTHRKGGAA